MNKVILIGHLGRDPEVKYSPSGLCVATMSLATTERYTKDGEKVQETVWHSLIAFGRIAEICSEYLTKGSHIAIEGKLKTSSWEGQDGTKRYKTQITIGSLEMLGGGSSRQQGQPASHQESQNPPIGRQPARRTPEYEDLGDHYTGQQDDIPF